MTVYFFCPVGTVQTKKAEQFSSSFLTVLKSINLAEIGVVNLYKQAIRAGATFTLYRFIVCNIFQIVMVCSVKCDFEEKNLYVKIDPGCWQYITPNFRNQRVKAGLNCIISFDN